MPPSELGTTSMQNPTDSTGLPKIKRIAIVGAGPGGLTAFKSFLEEGVFEEARAFERRDDIGGVWYLDPLIAKQEVDRYQETRRGEYPFRSTKPSDDGQEERVHWPSPAYEGMMGNIPRDLIAFSDFPWPKPTSSSLSASEPQDIDADTGSDGAKNRNRIQDAENEDAELDMESLADEDVDIFPTLLETIAYIKSYAAHFNLLPHVSLNAEVVSVRYRKRDDGYVGWEVKVKTRAVGEAPTEITSWWDAVVMAGGMCDSLAIPNIDGLEALPEEQVVHARHYRSPTSWTGKKILALGNGYSSIDICAQSAPLAKTPIYRSIHHPCFFACLPDERVIDVGPIKRLYIMPSDAEKIGAELEDGQILEDFDVVILGTGYRYEFPFLRIPSSDTQEDVPATPPDRRRILGLYKHFLHARYPTLGLISYEILFTTFSVAQAQACVLARLYSGRLALPSLEERVADEGKCIEEVGDDHLFHVIPRYMKSGGEPAYGQWLREWALSAPAGGSVGVQWDDKRRMVVYKNIVKLKTEQLRRSKGRRINGAY
ncbi:hypothetical protein BOTBODRAFT_50347 [Botryobasidium botryosum FD-172 SS1]|uniref:FAD/NAD(P)-binding domain-containing protein n=1 Tax=Botryobasidium botryosum (strain FD-172 SS1) TaxID=930990 RepID=A0A067N4B0_BOTB1|nr:hypothetical protein BOTBODRAFT_50347 [Botryobasidium botryosum FD-172 SS1]